MQLRLLSTIGLDGALVKGGAVVEVSDEVAKDLLRRGKASKDLAAEEEASSDSGELGKMTKAELLTMAKDLGLDVKASDSKQSLIAALEAAAK